MYDVVGLVPMKAHSERVPGKNVRPFNGRPLYQWAIETLFQSGVVDRVLINTDSPEILDEAPSVDPRVDVVERPAAIRGDVVPMNEILLHDVDHIESRWYLQTHATSPLIRPETVRRAVETIKSELDFDSLFTVTRLQTRLWTKGNEALNHNPNELLRTQDLEPVFEENSALYIFGADTLKARRNRIGYRPLMHEIPAEEAWDIDEEIDFLVAEFLHARDER